MPNKLSQFWQELKRRKVLRIITVYAAVSFVILQLVEILAPSLRLPEWTMNFILVLLIVGFVIAVILSWIYDIHPEGGIVKTEPAHKVKEDITQSSNSWKIASYISFTVIVGLIVLNVITRSGKKEILDKSIAVLPFQNLSDEEGNEYFVDGLVEDLLNKISIIEELSVTSRTSSDMYRERGIKSVPEIARELNVSYIIEGSVQRYGENARITVQLIDAVRDDHLWTKNYDRELVDIFRTQSEIAIQIAAELDAILSSKQKSIIQKEKTISIQAFELYQMGRFYWNKRTGEGFNKSIKFFEQAIEKDPGYGLAYAGLSDTYYLMTLNGHIDSKVGRDKALNLAFSALELDWNLSEAYTVLGSLYHYLDWDWDKAENAFQQALELNPNYSTAHQYYAEYLSTVGRHEEARMHINKAVELNPLSFVIRYVNALIYYHQGHFEEALRELNKCDEIQEGHFFTNQKKMHTYYQLGHEENAFQALRKILTNNPRYELEVAEQIYQDSGLQAVLQWKCEDDASIAEEENLNYHTLASNFALVGKNEEALVWLEQAFQIHDYDLVLMSYNIHFKPVHDHPRYQAILEDMGLGN
jgi:TolB-like protein